MAKIVICNKKLKEQLRNLSSRVRDLPIPRFADPTAYADKHDIANELYNMTLNKQLPGEA